MDKAEAQKAIGDMQRNCRAIYDDLFSKNNRECPDSLQRIYNESFALSGEIDKLPSPTTQPTQATGA